MRCLNYKLNTNPKPTALPILFIYLCIYVSCAFATGIPELINVSVAVEFTLDL